MTSSPLPLRWIGTGSGVTVGGGGGLALGGNIFVGCALKVWAMAVWMASTEGVTTVCVQATTTEAISIMAAMGAMTRVYLFFIRISPL
jgi:hypothetical protein